ncbi:MAG: LLM class flavin-dependent oxidoreductase [Acidimicrobiia bacterium]|nr:LLM class flavin-dependent oxidoreductase [Acidimicrobiia bacterium]
MKVRVGYGLGTRTPTLDGARFGALVDALEDLRFDSLWLSERISGPCPDPMVGLAFAAARSTKLKLGTSVQVLPGRNPFLLAKEWASLDRLSGGRTLPAFGLGVADPKEQAAFGVERKARAALFDDALPKVRRLWLGEEVDGVRVEPLPVQSPPEVWLGGIAPSELRRVGRLGDGWLPSFCTPADVEAGIPAIEAVAAAHDRAMDPEHWGALLPYLPTPQALPDVLAAAVAARRPDLEDPAEIVSAGLDAVVATIGRFVAAGASKFVLVPVIEPESWSEHLTEVAAAVRPLEN